MTIPTIKHTGEYHSSVYPFKRRGRVSQTLSHLEVIAPHRIKFSHKSFIPTPTMAVTLGGVCVYVANHLEGCILFIYIRR